MKILIIGLGQLGNYVLENISETDFVSVEVYTRGKPQYEKLLQNNVIFLDSLNDATQPDAIFITANLYKPEDRLSYLKNHLDNDDYLDFRDDEQLKNQEMILDIAKNIKHLDSVPTIITANPPELLVKLIHKGLGWNSIYNMQIMVDNMRISEIVGISESEYLCIGEHGRPVPILSHINKTESGLYEKINAELSKVGRFVYENKGVPPLEEAKKSLDKLIEAIIFNKELKCVLTVYDAALDVGFGKPFIIKGLNFIEQSIPDLSSQEKLLLDETKIRLIKKWGKNKLD